WSIDFNLTKRIELFKREMQRLNVVQVKLLYFLLLARLNDMQPVFYKNSIEYGAYMSLSDSVKEFLANSIVKNIIAQPIIKASSESDVFYEEKDMLTSLVRVMTKPVLKACKNEHK